MLDKQNKILTFLIVDENQQNISLLSEILENDFNLLISDNRKDALKLISDNSIDIAIIEINEPINGFSISEKILSSKKNQNTKIIYITEKTDTENINKAFKTGCLDVFTKPFNLNELKSKLNTFSSFLLTNKKLSIQKEQLLGREKQYRLLTETMQDVIGSIDKRAYLLYVSPSIFKFSDYEVKETIGTHISKYMYHKFELIGVVKLISDVFFNKKGGSFSFTFKPKNKAPFPVELTYEPIIEDEEITSIVFVMRNVSKHEQNEIKLKNILNKQGEGVGFTDKNEVFLFANNAAEVIFGVGKGGLINKSLSEFLPSKSKKIISKQTKIRKQGKKTTYEISIKNKKGYNVDILITATPKIDTFGNFQGSYGIFRDITSKKKLETQLKNSEKRYKELNASKDRLFSILSHDLKGPINSLSVFLKLQKNTFHKLDENKQKELFSLFSDSLDTIQNLVEDLLIWSRSQIENIKFNPLLVCTFTIISEIFTQYSGMAYKKKIKLINKIPENTLIYGDRFMINAIFRNLINNSIKFTQNGGKVEILISKNNNKEIEITVLDNGIGIDTQHINELFNIDKKHTSIGTNNEKGSGLGLSICKDFVEKHNGNINVTSKLNIGTSFKVTFPKKTQ